MKRQPEHQDHFEQSVAELSPVLQKEMREFQRQEAKLLKLLADPQVAEAFIHDPLGTLQQHGLSVPPVMQRRLQAFDSAAIAHLNKQAFLLPNGQTVTPQLRVRFTGRKEG